MKYLTQMLRKPSPETLMAQELDEAKRQLLAALTAREYAQAMVTYHEARIKRLSQAAKPAAKVRT